MHINCMAEQEADSEARGAGKFKGVGMEHVDFSSQFHHWVTHVIHLEQEPRSLLTCGNHGSAYSDLCQGESLLWGLWLAGYPWLPHTGMLPDNYWVLQRYRAGPSCSTQDLSNVQWVPWVPYCLARLLRAVLETEPLPTQPSSIFSLFLEVSDQHPTLKTPLLVHISSHLFLHRNCVP